MKVGILQTGTTPDALIEEHGGYADMFVTRFNKTHDDLSFQVYDIVNHQFPEGVGECDSWLITGSKFSVYEDHDWIEPLKVFTREIVAAKIPLIGVCFGHQLIAEALGGRVERSSKGWGLGLDTYTISPENQAVSGLIEQGSKQIKLDIFHQDQVVDLPENAQVFAESDFCKYAGIFYGDKVMTIQAHPEFSKTYNSALLNARKGTVISEELVETSITELKQSRANADSNRFGKWMGDFLKG